MRSNFRSEARAMLQQAQKRRGSIPKKGGKRRKIVWKHKFFCLAYVGQNQLPTTEKDKNELFEAGLGEKEIEFEQLDLSPEEFRKIIIDNFPQLEDAGGYQFCKCIPNSRKFEPLSSRVMSSPLLLRQRVGTARTYIVPLQKDLDLTPLDAPGTFVSFFKDVSFWHEYQQYYILLLHIQVVL